MLEESENWRKRVGEIEQREQTRQTEKVGKKTDCRLKRERREIERLRQRKQEWRRMRHKPTERLSV